MQIREFGDEVACQNALAWGLARAWGRNYAARNIAEWRAHKRSEDGGGEKT